MHVPVLFVLNFGKFSIRCIRSKDSVPWGQIRTHCSLGLRGCSRRFSWSESVDPASFIELRRDLVELESSVHAAFWDDVEKLLRN